MAFFKQFPIIDYDIHMSGNTQKLVDYFRLVDVNDILAAGSTSYTYYDIKNGERPDVVSQKLYDTPDYYWTFFILNDHLKAGYDSWPMADAALEKYINEKYNPYIFLTIPNNVRTFVNGVIKNDGLHGFPLNQFLAIGNFDNRSERGFIKEYNQDTYQLVINKVNDGDFSDRFTNSSFKFTFPEFINPYNVYSAEYANAEIIRRQWVESAYNWFINEYSYGNDLKISFETSQPEVMGGLQSQYDYAEAYVNYVIDNQPLPILGSSKSVPSISQPYYYENLNGEKISAFEAFYGNNQIISTGQSNPYDAKNYKTNYNYEVEINDAKSKIKVLQPNKLQEFVEQFKELINE